LQKDTSLFASKADKVSHLNVKIKDDITEIQIHIEDIEHKAKQTVH